MLCQMKRSCDCVEVLYVRLMFALNWVYPKTSCSGKELNRGHLGSLIDYWYRILYITYLGHRLKLYFSGLKPLLWMVVKFVLQKFEI